MGAAFSHGMEMVTSRADGQNGTQESFKTNRKTADDCGQTPPRYLLNSGANTLQFDTSFWSNFLKTLSGQTQSCHGLCPTAGQTLPSAAQRGTSRLP